MDPNDPRVGELRLHSQKSRELENAAYDEMFQIYEEKLKEGESLFDSAMRITNDLTDIDSTTLYQDQKTISVFRHMMRPYIAQDRLGQLAGLKRGRIQNIEKGGVAEREELDSIADVIRKYLDKDRFPWLDNDLSTEEKAVARGWSRKWTASHYADTTFRTALRMATSQAEEKEIANAFVEAGLVEDQWVPGVVSSAKDVPLGKFSRERRIRCHPPPNKKADSVARLDEERLLLIEAKHNIDELNARKRIAEVRDKATKWRESLGADKVVVGAVLSGFFPEDELVSLLEDGIQIFWKHDLEELVRYLRANASLPKTVESFDEA